MAARTWTPEQRQRQREAIQRWKPWSKSTGPQSPGGKAAASRNAWTGGHRAQLRELSMLVKAEIRQARELVDILAPDAMQLRGFTRAAIRSQRGQGAVNP